MSRPFLAGELHGLRAWGLESPGGDFLLSGYFGVTWTPGGEPTLAECHAQHPWTSGEGSHESPGHDCGCGLYGLHPWSDAGLAAFDDAPGVHGNGFGESLQIVGVIEAWGQVELHEDGFRAEHARPVMLTVCGSVKGTDYELLITKLAARYHTEVLWYEEPEEVIEVCRERGFGLSRPTVERLLATPEAADAPPEGDQKAPSALGDLTPPPRRRRGWVHGLLEIGSGLAAVVGSVIGVLIVGAICLSVLGGVLGIVGGILGLDLGGSADRLRVGKPNPKLSVIAEEIVRLRGRPLYVAVVRNRSEHLSALGIRPVETAFGHVDSRPNLAPGAVGVVLDEPRPSIKKRSDDSYSAGMTASMTRSDAPNVSVTKSRFDRGLCLVAATVHSSRPLAHLGLIALGTGRHGRFLGWARYLVGPVPRGVSTQIADRVSPVDCGTLDEVTLFPELGRGQMAGGKRVAVRNRAPSAT